MVISNSKKNIAADKAAAAAKADAALATALILAEPSPRNFVELAAVLDQLSERPDHIQKFITASGIGKRKVQYLISMHKKFSELQVSRDRMLALGWTKLITMRRAITAENVGEYLAEAEARTVAELQRYIKENEVEDEEVKSETSERRSKVVLLRFTESEYRKFSALLQRFNATEKGRGLKGKEKAIMRLVDTLGGK